MSKVKDVLNILSEADMCEDERFLALLNIHKNCMKDATGMLCVPKFCINLFL